ncbi:methyltransferase domain-containing protein [Acidianus sulfidivorans JP7]|uniref:Class I SAM-dependent methyltransferase n=1 Tax=Acidianus sulfidivorans JP7 TaxID=619593 RepID=A0A2U9IK68_9CREN|nr:class I SAM-dependent methyltransferase [Acidianus sulfidivorans]AWR96431.1 methyltransferase domain-containing protein [Acidianus sulfidivorans JP7]
MGVNYTEKELTKEAYEYIVYRRKPIDLIINDSPVADIGCGSGQNCRIIKGFSICLDIALNQLLVAKRRGCENLVQADMEYLPFRNESFKYLLYIASLHHLPSPDLALSEAYRVLKNDNGRILITVWERQIKFLFRRKLFLRSKINGKNVLRFYRFYFPWELKKYCEKNGFKTEKCKSYRVKSFLPNNVLYLGIKDSFNSR